MRQIDGTAAAIFERLVEGLKAGESRTIDNSDGVFMAVHVERLSRNKFSIAHYFEQEGDLCCDPDMTFVDVRRSN